jgi:hypothetical protein
VFIYLSIGEGEAENKLVCFSGYVVEIEMDYYIYFIGLGFGE